MNSISIQELFTFYHDTLFRCSFQLRDQSDDEISYQIFEEFDIGIISFFHEASLNRLLEANLISEEIFKLSSSLREQVLELQDDGEWDIEYFRISDNWTGVISIVEKIKQILNLPHLVQVFDSPGSSL
jgi:hypothetical protein